LVKYFITIAATHGFSGTNLYMNLRALIPPSGLPHSGHCENCEELWFGMDSLSAYRKRGGHRLYSENDIIYRFNHFGYRGSEFDANADVKVLSIGCSWTFGVGLPQEALFHERFAGRLRSELNLSVVNWNFGLSGASNDYVSRVLHLAVPLLNPDIILILFPRIGRREYVAAHDVKINYSPTSQSGDPVIKEIARHFAALSSTYDDQLNFFRNYKSVESLLAGRMWFFSMVKAEAGIVNDFLNPAHQAAQYRMVDKARDETHPGPQTNELIFEAFWSKFIETGGLNRCLKKA
jgi:hypothetical protein